MILITQTQANERRRFGRNLTNVIVEPWLRILVEEVFQPFYVFQLFSCILWLFESYFYFSGVIFVLAVASITTTLFDTIKALKHVSERAQVETRVSVLQVGGCSF